MGQERQFVAVPAAAGLRDLRKYFREPVEVMEVGRWGFVVAGSS